MASNNFKSFIIVIFGVAYAQTKHIATKLYMLAIQYIFKTRLEFSALDHQAFQWLQLCKTMILKSICNLAENNLWYQNINNKHWNWSVWINNLNNLLTKKSTDELKIRVLIYVFYYTCSNICVLIYVFYYGYRCLTISLKTAIFMMKCCLYSSLSAIILLQCIDNDLLSILGMWKDQMFR